MWTQVFLQQLNFGCWHGEGGCCWRRAAASDGDTRFIVLASLQGHKWVVKLLLDLKATPKAMDAQGVLASTHAKSRGYVATEKLLLGATASV